jgi:hypothetical protein
MSNSPDQPQAPGLGSAILRQEQDLSRLSEYHAAVDQLIGMSLGRVRIFDQRLGREYNALARMQLMRTFLLANSANRIAIVVHEPGNIRTECPRLVSLQRQFGHALGIHRTLSLARGVYDPFCVTDGSHFARRFHFNSPRGVVCLNDPERAGELVQRFAEIWDVSQPAVTATTLGL